MSKRWVVCAGISAFLLLSARARAQLDARGDGGVQVYQQDLAGFLVAAGELEIIDFETLPDGSPSQGGEFLTDTFNYTSWGVTFSTPLSDPRIAGPPGDRAVDAFEFNFLAHTWLIADLVVPSRAVGIEFGGTTWFRAYDINGGLIAQTFFSSPGGPWFLGIVSTDVPIARVTADDGDNSELIDTFIFNPTPEPVSAALLAAAALFPRRRRR